MKWYKNAWKFIFQCINKLILGIKASSFGLQSKYINKHIYSNIDCSCEWPKILHHSNWLVHQSRPIKWCFTVILLQERDRDRMNGNEWDWSRQAKFQNLRCRDWKASMIFKWAFDSWVGSFKSQFQLSFPLHDTKMAVSFVWWDGEARWFLKLPLALKIYIGWEHKL